MNFSEYQAKAVTTAVYPVSANVVYPALGLANEAGEVLGKVKKVLRGDHVAPVVADNMTAKEFFDTLSEDARLAIGAEIGDVLWYAAALASDLGIDLQAIAEMNIEKLQTRKRNGTLKGNGDDR